MAGLLFFFFIRQLQHVSLFFSLGPIIKGCSVHQRQRVNKARAIESKATVPSYSHIISKNKKKKKKTLSAFFFAAILPPVQLGGCTFLGVYQHRWIDISEK